MFWEGGTRKEPHVYLLEVSCWPAITSAGLHFAAGRPWFQALPQKLLLPHQEALGSFLLQFCGAKNLLLTNLKIHSFLFCTVGMSRYFLLNE